MARRNDWLMRNAGLLLAGGTIAFLAYTFWPGEAQTTGRLSVRSVNQNSQEINGMWTVLTRRDGTREERFTPTAFENVPTGEAHTLQTDSFADRTFQMWSDGNTSKVRPVTLSGDRTIQSVYSVPTTPPPAGGMGMTIFAYYPFTNVNDHPWNKIVAVKQEFPALNLIVVANPCSGGCYGQQWVKNMKVALTPFGIKVIGYVATGDCCGSSPRSLSAIRSNISAVRNDGLDGVFFDESASAAPDRLQVYRDAVAYSRSLGMMTNVGNPGSCIIPLGDIFDIVCTFEDSFRPPLSNVRDCTVPIAKKSIIPHNVGGSFDLNLVRSYMPYLSYYYEVTQYNAWHVPSAFPSWFRDIAVLLNNELQRRQATSARYIPIAIA